MAAEGPTGGEGDALTEQGRGGSMPNDLGAIARALHVGPAECARRKLGHRFRAERAARGAGGQQHGGAGPSGPVVGARAEASFAHLWRERKTGRTTMFASHGLSRCIGEILYASVPHARKREHAQLGEARLRATLRGLCGASA
jgi:hypothetical protein